MEPIKKQCIFCDNPSGFKGNEHVISRWILDRLNARYLVEPWRRDEVNVGQDGLLTYSTTERRVANHDQLRSGYVCDKCNSELNIQLEIPFQKIDPDLIRFPYKKWSTTPVFLRTENPLIKLSFAEKQVIARWAAKTTCVVESVTPGRKEERNWIAADAKHIRTMPQLPDGWVIFAKLHHPSRPTFMTGSRTWRVNPSWPEDVRSILPRTPRTIIQIGSLILLTVYIGDPRLRVQAVRGTHFPLIINSQVEWLEVSPNPERRGTPDEPPDSTVNISFYLADSLSLMVDAGGRDSSA